MFFSASDSLVGDSLEFNVANRVALSTEVRRSGPEREEGCTPNLPTAGVLVGLAAVMGVGPEQRSGRGRR